MRTLLFKTAKGVELYEVQQDETGDIRFVSTNPEEVMKALLQDAASCNPMDKAEAKRILWGIHLFGGISKSYAHSL